MSQYNPYQPPRATLSGFGGPARIQLAERGTRLAAAFVDGLVFGIVVIPVAIGAALGSGKGSKPELFSGVMIGVMVLAFLGLFGLNLYFLATDAQSIGKKILKIRIVDMQGTKATFGRIFLRRMIVPGLIGAIPIAGPLFSLVDCLFIFRDDRRCIHDLIADTQVVVA